MHTDQVQAVTLPDLVGSWLMWSGPNVRIAQTTFTAPTFFGPAKTSAAIVADRPPLRMPHFALPAHLTRGPSKQ